jgi:ABC-2 type transport system permease protein
MRWRNVFAIVKKDLLEVRQNKAAWMPMVIVPLIFVLVLPLVAIVLPQYFPNVADSMVNDPDLQMMMNHAPAVILNLVHGLGPLQTMVVLVLGYLFAPFFLIFPLAFSSVVAAESFAGERERKTMEALLYTPATEIELFMGKVLTALIPSLGISWLSFLGYIVVLNAAGFSLFDRIWFPIPTWYPLIFWITPALAVLAISVTVLISARVQTFMGAYQLSASLVLLVIALLVGQLSGVLYFTVGVGMLVGLVFWLISGGLLWLALKGFSRAKLLGSKES